MWHFGREELVTNQLPPDLSFEQGPIRPPSESRSLLIRVTRNCPWNRCGFCAVYRGSTFSIRNVDDVIADIRQMRAGADWLSAYSERLGEGGALTVGVLRALREETSLGERNDKMRWLAHVLARGVTSAFLQDANSLVMPAPKLVRVLESLRTSFPQVGRVTSYARAHTVTKRNHKELASLHRAGLTRLHIGLESGCDAVLELVRKGVDQKRHIAAGQRVVAAGIELSEYYMPGLGGRALSEAHARDSAATLSAIAPHFIRLRSTVVVPRTELANHAQSGRWQPLGEEQVIEEIRQFVDGLTCTTTLVSDHSMNLLIDLEGKLPEDRPRLLHAIEAFQQRPPLERRAFIVGRRLGWIRSLDELDVPQVKSRLLTTMEALGIDTGEHQLAPAAADAFEQSLARLRLRM